MIITPEHIASLKALITSPHWILFKEIIKENDLNLLKKERDELLSIENSTFNEVKRIQYRINVLEEVLEIPEKLIALSQEVKNESNPDPYYDSVDEIKEENRQQV